VQDGFVKNAKQVFVCGKLVAGRVLVVKEASRSVELSLKPSVVTGEKGVRPDGAGGGDVAMDSDSEDSDRYRGASSSSDGSGSDDDSDSDGGDAQSVDDVDAELAELQAIRGKRAAPATFDVDGDDLVPARCEEEDEDRALIVSQRGGDDAAAHKAPGRRARVTARRRVQEDAGNALAAGDA
jgi:hypothetical protein